MKLFFRRYGEGPPLVILHGLYGSSDNWASIARRLSSKFSVYLPDQRNHGESPHSDVHDYPSMCDDIKELADDQGLKSFFLAGHSMGGKTAVLFARRWPGRISGLVVADISPFETKISNASTFRQHLELLQVLAGTDISRAASRDELEKLFSESIPSARTRSLLMKNARRKAAGGFEWKINNKALLKNLDRIAESVADEGETVEPVTGFPVLFLKGEKSEYLPAGDFPKIIRLFPAAEFLIISNAGHWIHADNPDEVCAAFFSLLT
ncbi:MAG: alpha/beta fold hydrolase [Bacteroidales bacterium]|jgi:pimeloyl-ACP methyl ester carboxylesterase|nr:alpha/beta fold hydrolase [Bacteroidales bacterium]